MIGGKGRVVQIYESLFVRRKYNRDRLTSQQGVFGGIDILSKECFLVPVERRDADTLRGILQDNVKKGSIIMNDQWSGYVGWMS